MRFASPRIDAARLISPTSVNPTPASPTPASPALATSISRKAGSRKRFAWSLSVGLAFVALNATSMVCAQEVAEPPAKSELTETEQATDSPEPSVAPTESASSASKTPPPISPLSIELPTQSEGELEFDNAVKLRMTVESMEDLNKVIDMTEGALKKDLSPLNLASAKLFLSSAYKQRVEQKMRSVMQAPRNRAAVSKMLGELLSDLTRSIELDPELVDSYLLKVAILRDRQEFDEALKVVDQAIVIQEPKLEAKGKSSEFRDRLAKLYIARSTLREDTNVQIEDLEKAVTVNPVDIAVAKQLLSAMEIQQTSEGKDNTDRMIQVIDRSLEFTTDNLELQLAKIGLLLRAGRTEDAIAFSSKAIDQATSDENKSSLLRQRAMLQQIKGDSEAAKKDLDASIGLGKDSAPSILLRSRLSAEQKDYEAAKKDVDTLLELDEGNIDALLLRGDLAAATDDFDGAIADYRRVLGNVPNGNPAREGLLLKLSLVFWQSNRHSQAIRNLDQIIQANPQNWQAYRLKGEIYLGQGAHAEAIDSYDQALKLLPEQESAEVKASLFNNLSWVLATSPEDELRNGKRAIELGLKACELTEYKQAHILSTLAAAYAETGDFEKAVEFSEKSVQLGKESGSDQLEQLEAELESFRDKKPWREKQEVSEAKKPNIPAPTGPET